MQFLDENKTIIDINKNKYKKSNIGFKLQQDHEHDRVELFRFTWNDFR